REAGPYVAPQPVGAEQVIDAEAVGGAGGKETGGDDVVLPGRIAGRDDRSQERYEDHSEQQRRSHELARIPADPRLRMHERSASWDRPMPPAPRPAGSPPQRDRH